MSRTLKKSDNHKWRDRAECIGAPNEIFFPTSMSIYRYDQAKAICEICPVTQECLESVLDLEDLEDRWGVFGGLTPPERAEVRWKNKLKNK